VTTLITATNGAGTTTPDLVNGYEAEAASRNIFVDLLDGTVASVLRPPRPRSGTLQLVYQSKASAWSAFALHKQQTTFSITDTDVSDIGMTYAIDGDGVQIGLDDETRSVWVVSVTYQELT
jgi:hypothetical protein